ncbi:outer membrane lipoprotein-sorting protein [Elusimicrobiota bacterium]
MKIQKCKLSFLFALAFCLLFSSVGNAISVKELKRIAKVKEEQLKKEIADSSIVVKTVSIIPNEGKMTHKTTLHTKGAKTRMELEYLFAASPEMNQKNVYVYDGKNNWTLTPTGKKMMDGYSGEEKSKFQKIWIDIPENTKVLKEEKINGRECYVLLIPSKYKQLDSSVYSWLDKNTLIWVKKENKKDKTVTIMSDFRKIKGKWEFPYKTETFSKGKLYSTQIVEKYEINKGVSDKLFNVDNIQEAPEFGFPSLSQAQMDKFRRLAEKKYGKKNKGK